jgi:hypothetical protein
MTPGAEYTFKVQARNSVGYSDFSDPITILAAQSPDQIEQPVTQRVESNIVVSWVAPWNGGAVITDY